MRPDLEPVLARARRQEGVLSRAQATSWLSEGAVRWLLATGQWQRIHPGVYAVHRGPVTWRMRAHAALLYAGESALLARRSAAFVWGFETKAPPVIDVVIPHERRVQRPPGVRLHRARTPSAAQVRGLRVTEAAATVLDCCGSPVMSERDVVALVADAVSSGAVTAEELAASLAGRARHRVRRVIRLAIGDVDEGAETVLEVMALRDVIRAHGLPEMTMQVPEDGGRIRRDFSNAEFRIILEVDGRRGHEGSGRIADLRRDRKASSDGWISLRAGWVEVDLEPCDIAIDLFLTFQSRGFTGQIRPCGQGCAVLRLTTIAG